MAKHFIIGTYVFVAFGCAALGNLGCASKSTTTSSSDPSAIDEGSDSNDTESDSESMGTSFIGTNAQGGLAIASAGDLTNKAGDLALDGLGDAAKGFYKPAGCLVVTDDAASKKVAYAFSDCTGPYGLVHVTGTVTLTYSSSAANQLTLNFAASGLKINGATVDWTATASVTANGQARDMTWNGHFSGTTRHGRAFQRTNTKEYKWTAGTACLSVSGSSEGTVTGHDVKTDVTSFQICKGVCPEAGSEIKITDVTAAKTYDVKWGAGDATYTGPDGKSVSFTPICARF